jgi:hypothetical protein
VDPTEKQLEQEKRWPDLIAHLKKRAESEPSMSARIALLERAARLFHEKFSNVAEAIKLYEQIIEIDLTHRQAIDYLTDWYEKRRAWDQLAALLERQIANATGDAERLRAKLHEIGERRAQRSAPGSGKWVVVVATVVGIGIGIGWLLLK